MILQVLLCGLIMAGAAQAQSRLESLDLRSETLGLEAVGQLDIDGRGFCTGVLVDNDLVLTAAHCLYHGGERMDPRKIVFRAGLRHGEAVAESAVRRAVVLAGYRPDDRDGLRQLQNDAALLQLVDRIPLATAAAFATSSAIGRGDRVEVVSYARGRSGTLSREDGCRVTNAGYDVLAFDCDVDFGSSGAPVFKMMGNRQQVVSIISRGHREGARVVSYGMLADPVLQVLRRAMIEGRGVFPAEEVKGRTVRIGEKRSVGGANFVRP